MVTVFQMAVLRHATADGEGWRRYYCAEDGDTDCPALVEAGLMVLSGRPPAEGLRYFVVTDAGLALVRQDVAEERRRLGLRAWRVEIEGYGATIVDATTRSKARWKGVRGLADDLPLGEPFGRAKVRRA